MSHGPMPAALNAFWSRSPRAVLSAVAVLLVASASRAQTSATDAAASAPEPGLAEIIVTAQRRAEDLQQVPMAVSVLAGAALEKSNIVDLTGLNGFVPGLSVEKSSGSELMISIRGLGSETPQNLYTQPGVSVFVDGIYIPVALGVYQGFFDLDRAEVLRGPQGTLFGQSSTGGTINLISKQPLLGSFGGDTGLSYGNYELNREQFDLNIPLSDSFAVRGAFQHYAHDGFGEDIALPSYGLDVANDTQGKLSALWQPSEQFSSTTTIRLYAEDHNGAEQKNILDPNPDARQVEQDFPSFLQMHYQIYSESLNWQLPWATLKSISGYQNMLNDQGIDDDRLTSAILGYYNAQPEWLSTLHAYTQEFDLVSKSGAVLDWVAGLFYIWQQSSQYIVEFENSGPEPSSFDIPPPSGPSPANVSYEEYSTIYRNSYSPFFQSTYHLSDRLRLTGGARYNHDAYDGHAGFYYAPQAKVPGFSSHVLTGKAEVDYDLRPGEMLYASWTRGYKPGGINNTWDSDAVLLKQFFQPEIATSYEIGSKNRLLNDRLSLNAAGFFYVYRDMQYLSSDPYPYQDGTANIPDTHIWGTEIEAAYVALQNHLRLNASMSALNGRFVDNYYAIDAQSAAAARAVYEAANPGSSDYSPATIAAVAAAARNTIGNVPPKLPRLSGSLDAAYSFDIRGDQKLTPRLEYVYRGAFDYRVFDSATLDSVGSYDLWNFYLEYQPPVKGLRLSVAATNLGNVDGIAGRFTDPYGSGQTSNEFIAPRQVVFSAGYSF
jgi:iron complex outermembrane receptor protein